MNKSENIDTFFSDIGIDSIGFYAPRTYISLDELAHARNVNPDKYKYGLMANEMRFPSIGEDSISLGLKAAHNAVIRGKINPEGIDGVFVGTETPVYITKSMANIYEEILGVSKNCITQDIINACAAGTIAILNAVSMIQSGILKKILVISVDISSYDVNSPGEPTQGAGAVALIISKNPRLVTFSKRFGKASANINDFYRPIGEKNAQAFGKYSIEAYLSLQLDAYDDLFSDISGLMPDYYILHAPYAKLPLKFMHKLIKERWVPHFAEIRELKQKNFTDFLVSPYFNHLTEEFLLRQDILEDLREYCIHHQLNYEEAKNWILQKLSHSAVAPLQVPSMFGNMYSASLWAELIFVLENGIKPGDIIYFGSYGSGSVSIAGLLQIQPQCKSAMKNGLSIQHYMEFKNLQNIKQYEMIKRFNGDSGIISQNLVLVKLTPLPNLSDYGLNLSFCDFGCNLTSYQGLDYCPNGHPGHNRRFFPIMGSIQDIRPYNPCDLSPIAQGYVLAEGQIFLGDTVEFELLRWKNTNPEVSVKKGLINWMPIYHRVSKLESTIGGHALEEPASTTEPSSH